MTSASWSRPRVPGGHRGHASSASPSRSDELGPQRRQVVEQIAHDEPGLGLEERAAGVRADEVEGVGHERARCGPRAKARPPALRRARRRTAARRRRRPRPGRGPCWGSSGTASPSTRPAVSAISRIPSLRTPRRPMRPRAAVRIRSSVGAERARAGRRRGWRPTALPSSRGHTRHFLFFLSLSGIAGVARPWAHALVLSLHLRRAGTTNSQTSAASPSSVARSPRSFALDAP